jgi:hypothetical protein
MNIHHKSTLTDRKEKINNVEQEIKGIEARILKEERQNSYAISILSKISYVLVSVLTLLIVLSGVYSFQSNVETKVSQAGVVYNCNAGETLTNNTCVIPAKENATFETVCPTAFVQMKSVCVRQVPIVTSCNDTTVNGVKMASMCALPPCFSMKMVYAETGFCKIDPTKLNDVKLSDVSDYDGRQCSETAGFNLKKITFGYGTSQIVCANILNGLDKTTFRVVDTKNNQILEVGNFETRTTNSTKLCPSNYTVIENGTKCSRSATTTNCNMGGEYLKDGKCEPCPAGKFCPVANGTTTQVPVCANGGTLSEDKTRCVANNKITYTKYIDGCSSEYIKLDKTCAIKEIRDHSLGCTYYYASGNENIKAVDSGTLAGMPACSTGGRQDFATTSIVKVADFNCDGVNTAWYNYNVAFDPLVCGTNLSAGVVQFRWTAQSFSKITPLQKIVDGQVRECPVSWLDAGGDSCYQAPIIRQVTTFIDCPINTFAPMGSVTCTVCPVGTTSPMNSTSAEACKPIVCTNGTINAPACNVCPSTQMMTNNQCVVIPVVTPVTTVDTRVNVIELPKPKIVEPCVSQPGYYTDTNGFCQICPIGYYCPGKTNSPIVCPVGTTTTYQGAKSQTECKAIQVQVETPVVTNNTTTIIRTIRTGGMSYLVAGLSVAVMFAIGYYYVFMSKSKGKFYKNWSKIK